MLRQQRIQDWDAPSSAGARSQSVTGDRTSVPRLPALSSPPPSIRPEPAYIVASAASQIITNVQEGVELDFSTADDGLLTSDPALVTPPSLKLVNGFLDHLLYNFMGVARSTSLGRLRAAIIEVLRPTLAREAIAGADHELQEYLGVNLERELSAAHEPLDHTSGWDLDAVWRRTRLRCMVYSSLGDMEEEEEEEDDDDSETDELEYFAPNRPSYQGDGRSRPRRNAADDDDERRAGPAKTAVLSRHRVGLRHPDSLLEVISQVWQKEGAWGVWKGANATFVYSVLLKAIESWTRSLLAAIFNVPDPGLLPRVGVAGLNVADSSQPLTSLGIAVAAAGIAGLFLSPLDVIRTRLVVTPVSSPSRSLLSSAHEVSKLGCPPSLLPLTLIHSTLPALFSSATPLFLRTRLGVDPIVSPAVYSALTFVSATVELFLRLPLETVLRRCQANLALKTPSPATRSSVHPQGGSHKLHDHPHRQPARSASAPQPADTIIAIGPYKGIAGTIWSIMCEEGEREQAAASSATQRTTATSLSSIALHSGPSSQHNHHRHPARNASVPAHARAKRRKAGQGIHGLWRGWRVGMWGLVGMWGASALGGADNMSEF